VVTIGQLWGAVGSHLSLCLLLNLVDLNHVVDLFDHAHLLRDDFFELFNLPGLLAL